ncbi:MAG: hypothetical protein LRY37_01635 [Alkalibacterium thalassium]|nr:hypothetical protein [Alkalibacterium thalassium]
MTFFVETDKGRYERFEEVHSERTYPVEVYIQLLKKAGFRTVDVNS